MTHKSHFWRDIDKHPLPVSDDFFDIRLSCISTLIECSIINGEVYFRGCKIPSVYVTQWRDAK